MRTVRFGISAALLTMALAAPGAVAAHVDLVSSTPDDGQSVDEPPTEVVIVFDGELNPDGSEFTVTDEAGVEVGSGEVDLEVPDRSEMRGSVEISDEGTYTVSWTSVAEDGDEATGEFTFTYATGGAEGAEGEQPNTAVSARADMGPALPIGVALLLTGSALIARASRARLALRLRA